MSDYRLRIDEIKGAEVVTSYTRWLASVETIGSENQEEASGGVIRYSASFTKDIPELLDRARTL
jgi:hypothetical protein